MMLYKNTKVKVNSLDEDTDYFDIIAGGLKGDILAPYLFIICLDNVIWTSIDLKKKKGVTLTKKEAEDARINYYRRGHRWLHNASGKHTHPPKLKPCYIVWNENLVV